MNPTAVRPRALQILLFLLCAAVFLCACGTTGRPSAGTVVNVAKTLRSITASPSGGGYYKDDGPADDIPIDLDAVPNATPKYEPLHKAANKPYEVLGKKYVPQTEIRPFRQEGIASWYGKKFHGQKTSIGDTYDMFAMTAAHPTLPLPSYVRITNPASGRAVIVRLNDRGPFHAGRIIDLSYAAAHKLGYVNDGSARVIVEAIVPGTAPPSPVYATVEPRDSAQLDALSQKLMSAQDSEADNLFDLPPPTPQSTGVFLQLGAFASMENAENLKNHLTRELDWLVDPPRIDNGGNLYRLQLGPYADRASAEQVAQRIQSYLGYMPTIINPR